MNPHFVFNSLGSIQNYLIKNKVRDAISYLSQFARLIRQNLYAVNLTVIDLDEEIVRLRNYLDLERIRLENKFEYSIDIEEPFNEDSFIIPSMIIQPFAENAIWHGIATMENNGLVSISFILFTDQLIKIVIEDNGIGVEKASKAAKSNSNATKKHLHLGMEMTKKRLQLLNQKYNVDAHLEITDVNPGTEYPGTRVSIYIPFNFEIGGSSLMVVEDED
jgi:LytS/YehU family sensor histidine kinase